QPDGGSSPARTPIDTGLRTETVIKTVWIGEPAPLASDSFSARSGEGVGRRRPKQVGALRATRRGLARFVGEARPVLSVRGGAVGCPNESGVRKPVPVPDGSQTLGALAGLLNQFNRSRVRDMAGTFSLCTVVDGQEYALGTAHARELGICFSRPRCAAGP